VFRAKFHLSSGALDCVYSLRYNAPTMLPVAGSLEAEFLRFQATGRQHRWYIIPQAANTSLVLLKMGEIIARNMSSWLRNINKSLSLHLVGCLYYLIQWCMVKQVLNSYISSLLLLFFLGPLRLWSKFHYRITKLYGRVHFIILFFVSLKFSVV
jgi:hypothetical protein